MTDYQLGKIYKIVDNTSEKVYIGSTCKTLKRRLSYHVYDYKYYLQGKYSYVSSFEIIKNNDYEIILIEAFPCDYKDELLARERYWTKQIDCINKNKPGIYNELGKLEYQKEYKTKHQDHIKEKYDCVCGGKYTTWNKSQHSKTSKHRKYIQTEALKQCLFDKLTFEETYQKYKTLL